MLVSILTVAGNIPINKILNIMTLGDRIPVGARFSAPAQTGPGAHPASYTMGIESLSRR